MNSNVMITPFQHPPAPVSEIESPLERPVPSSVYRSLRTHGDDTNSATLASG